jgi:hypothetical protein
MAVWPFLGRCTRITPGKSQGLPIRRWTPLGSRCSGARFDETEAPQSGRGFVTGSKGPSAEGSHTQTVYANDLRNVNNRYWYYYAQNASGSRVWAGPISVQVSNQAFNHCLGVGRTDWWIAGFRLLDLGNANNAVIYLSA